MISNKRNLTFITLVSAFIFVAGCHRHSDYAPGNSQYGRQVKQDTTVNGAAKTPPVNSENKPAETK